MTHESSLAMRSDFRSPRVGFTAPQAFARTLRERFVIIADARELVLFELFEIEQRGVRALGTADQLVELDLYGLRIAVLRVLNQEHHQECHDGGSGVDHELPR